MNQALIDKIVNAVLYEGYILYPYRPSVKNRQRWTFGGVYPRSFSETQECGDSWWMQTECLLRSEDQSRLNVKVRFLHLLDRFVKQLDRPRREIKDTEELCGQIVESLQVGDKRFQTWQEAVEREITLPECNIQSAECTTWRTEFGFPGFRKRELIRRPDEEIIAVLEREQHPVIGTVEVTAERISHEFNHCGAETPICCQKQTHMSAPYSEWLKIRVRIENRSPLEPASFANRDEALLRSMASTHTILEIEGGEFISLLDPPEECRETAAACQNVGGWPVLVGAPGQRDTLLSSPIILYDYPEIAPESPGDLFDGTEIDEILSLRILTMTDEEKLAAASVDERVRALLERTETMGPQQFRELHGRVRQVRPVASGGST
jgi:hypothetical protein